MDYANPRLWSFSYMITFQTLSRQTIFCQSCSMMKKVQIDEHFSLSKSLSINMCHFTLAFFCFARCSYNLKQVINYGSVSRESGYQTFNICHNRTYIVIMQPVYLIHWVMIKHWSRTVKSQSLEVQIHTFSLYLLVWLKHYASYAPNVGGSFLLQLRFVDKTMDRLLILHCMRTQLWT